MPSQLNVDTLVAANGTDPVTLTKQSAAKAWILFSMSAGTVTDDVNFSSITDDSTGVFTLSFSSAMANATYAMSASGCDTGAGPVSYIQHQNGTRTTSQVEVRALDRNGSGSDTTKWEGSFHGDLA